MNTAHYEIPAQVMARQIGDELVLLDAGSGTYYGLNPVGARIWQLLADGRDSEQIRAALLKEFDASSDAIAQDLERLIGELLSRQLIRRIGD